MTKRTSTATVSRPGPGRRPSPRDVRLDEVLLAGLERADPGPDGTRLQRTRFEEHKTLTRALAEFWGHRPVAGATKSSAREYRIWRAARDRRRGGAPKPVSQRTLTSQLSFLKTQINLYAAERDLNWPAVDLGSLAHGSAKPLNALTRAEVVRLLWGARAATYAPDAPDAPARGLKPPCFRPPAGEAVPGARRRLRQHLLRLLLVCYYTGSTAHCATRLRWRGSPDGGHSFVDVEAGMLYRLGPDAAPGKAAGMPVPVSARLLTHLRRWEAADARDGHDRVVHGRRGNDAPLAPPAAAFRAARSDAGFEPHKAQMSMLQHATGAELMRKGVTVRSVAMYMGLSPKTVEQRYAKHSPTFHEGARRALEKRGRSIRSIPRTSVAWRSAQTGRREERDG